MSGLGVGNNSRGGGLADEHLPDRGVVPSTDIAGRVGGDSSDGCREFDVIGLPCEGARNCQDRGVLPSAMVKSSSWSRSVTSTGMHSSNKFGPRIRVETCWT